MGLTGRDAAPPADVAEALRVLGKRTLAFGIHDPSFPSRPEDDVGRGSPYAEGGVELLRFVRELGFNAVQLGPQGETSLGNRSPYDATLFSRSTLSIALRPLVEARLLDAADLGAIVSAKPRGDRMHHAYVFDAARRALRAARAAYERTGRGRGLDDFARASAPWLDSDASAEDDPALFRFAQMVAHEQHAALRRRIAPWGLKLFADVQIGFSTRDEAAYRHLFLAGYRMGAPPSRTNPDGQPWGFPVLDPASRRGEAAAFFRRRIGKLLDEFDGLRVDHPHGLVCPWVYRADDPDPLRAVAEGARLFESPDLPDHPELAPLAIARSDQLDRAQARYADRWVRELDEGQVDRYAELFDLVIACAAARGRETADVVCEVLSTQPYPLERVLARHGLGRFRVTQKAKPDDPRDVYRSDNARPRDWIMLGNHDTEPIWRVVQRWRERDRGGAGVVWSWARYLAARLAPARPDSARAAFARRLVEDDRRLIEALFADLFASEAENVFVFFSDLFGYDDVYNVPGVVNDDNWTLRVRPSWRQEYPEMAERGAALHLPRALALALRARSDRGDGAPYEALVARLEASAAHSASRP